LRTWGIPACDKLAHTTLPPHRIARDDSQHVFLGQTDVREGTILGRENYALVSQHTRQPCQASAQSSPQRALEPVFLAAFGEETRTRRFASLAAAMVAASLDTRALHAPRQSEVLRPMVRGDAIERAIQGNDKRAGGPVPQPALMVARLAIASPSQADDIGAHRQQNGDAYGDNDQEEFSHCSASRRPQRKAAGIVLC
jgi:hypothetical protein